MCLITFAFIRVYREGGGVFCLVLTPYMCVTCQWLANFLNIICMPCFIFFFSEVLKQVWDLSDQDNDSMLSLREFCIALYLMERHREGRVLPAVLPSNIMVDLPTSGQPAAPYSAVPWGNPSGVCPIISSFYFTATTARYYRD